MTELDFFSPEVDNETEATGEEFEPQNTDAQCLQRQKIDNAANNSLHSNFLGGCEKESGKETVEICQKTVNPHNRVSSENFNIQRVIGKGGYGKVFLVQKVDGIDQGKLYAMKVLKKARLICNEKDKAHTVSERNILEMLRHPFLVRLHYAFQNHSNLYIVLEYCPGGELFNYLEHEGALLENAACFYTAEIVLAIGHLHSLGIIYRDLKSENVLLDRQGHVKLTDFGLSKEGVCTTNTFCGTIEYMAPEIIKYEGHGKAVDWWSLGTLLFDMLSGGPPFSQEESREATTHKILTAPLKFPPSFSPEVTSLIKGLLKRDPKERLGSKDDVEEIKRHKFFRRHEINWSDVFHRRLRPPFKPRLLADNDVSMFDPTFTRLQPIVSPSDAGRSIPTDLFQGFSYVAPSVCEDSVRDTWTEPNSSSSRRRHHGDRIALSTGRLRRLGAAPTNWTAKPDATVHTRTGHLEATATRRSGMDLPVRNGMIANSTLPAPQLGTHTGMGPPVPESRNGLLSNAPREHLKPGSFLPPSASQVTLTGQCPEDDLDTGLESELVGDLSSLVDSCKGDDAQAVKNKSVHDEDEEGVDDDDDDDDDDDELEEENVPGAKQIQVTNGCTFFSPPPLLPQQQQQATNTKQVLAYNFTGIVQPKEEQQKPKPFTGYPIPLTHSASGQQLRSTGTTGATSASLLGAMPPYSSHRSYADLKAASHNKVSGATGNNRLVIHPSDVLSTLTGGSAASTGRRSAVPPAGAHKMPALGGGGAPRTDVSIPSTTNSAMITTTTTSPHQNNNTKCVVM